MANEDLIHKLRALIEEFRAEAKEAKETRSDDDWDCGYYWGSYETYLKCAAVLENVLKESGVNE